MKDLIDRNAAIDVAENAFVRGLLASPDIRRLPSAEPEIIYCRDCVHAIEDALCGGYWCKGKAVTSNHYCGYAERRTDGRD